MVFVDYVRINEMKKKNTIKQKRWSEVDGDGDNKYKKRRNKGKQTG